MQFGVASGVLTAASGLSVGRKPFPRIPLARALHVREFGEPPQRSISGPIRTMLHWPTQVRGRGMRFCGLLKQGLPRIAPPTPDLI